METLISLNTLGAFVQVVFIDISLAADNAVVIGLAAAGLVPAQRRKAIFWGILAATVLRIGFATVTVQLLELIGLTVAGGVLLLWVCWKMWCDLHPNGVRAAFSEWRGRSDDALAGAVSGHPDVPPRATSEAQTLRQAVVRIIIADISMSLDNVLAVAGAARNHPIALAFGLLLSIALMGAAAMTIAKLLDRHKWIAYLGLAIVLYVALHMIAEGSKDVLAAMS